MSRYTLVLEGNAPRFRADTKVFGDTVVAVQFDDAILLSESLETKIVELEQQLAEWRRLNPTSDALQRKLTDQETLQLKITALEGRLKKAASDGADYLGLYNAETLRVKALEGEKERLEEELKSIRGELEKEGFCLWSDYQHVMNNWQKSGKANTKLQKQVEGYREALREIANKDYRGNRPESSVIAYKALMIADDTEGKE